MTAFGRKSGLGKANAASGRPAFGLARPMSGPAIQAANTLHPVEPEPFPLIPEAGDADAQAAGLRTDSAVSEAMARLADRANVLDNPDLAAARMSHFMAVNGVGK